MYFCVGNKIYKTDRTGAVTLIPGDLMTNHRGRVYFADNGIADFKEGDLEKILMITDGTAAYYINTALDDAVVKITDADFTDVIVSPTRVIFNDGYFLIQDSATQNVIVSSQYWQVADGWDSLQAFVVQSTQDKNQAMILLNDQVWIWGTDSYEIYVDTGSTQVYDPLAGTSHTVGTAAKHSVATNGKNVFWLGSNAQGQNKILMNEGYDYRVISTVPIEKEIENYEITSDAVGYCYNYTGEVYQIRWKTTTTRWLRR
jgi:hypothetical protein